eukprot:15356503-Ditylum_brightwellii.AAC.1
MGPNVTRSTYIATDLHGPSLKTTVCPSQEEDTLAGLDSRWNDELSLDVDQTVHLSRGFGMGHGSS